MPWGALALAMGMLLIRACAMEPDEQNSLNTLLIGSPSGFQAESRSQAMQGLMQSRGDAGHSLEEHKSSPRFGTQKKRVQNQDSAVFDPEQVVYNSVPKGLSSLNPVGEDSESQSDSFERKFNQELFKNKDLFLQDMKAFRQVLKVGMHPLHRSALREESTFLLTQIQDQDFAMPYLVELNPEESRNDKMIRCLWSVVLGVGVANGMIPVYLQTLESRRDGNLSMDSWLPTAMWITGTLFALETILRMIHRPFAFHGVTCGRYLAQLPTIAMPVAMLAVVELDHRRQAATTGFDEYLTFLCVVGPFLLIHAALDAWSRCEAVFKPKALRNLEASVEALTSDELRRIRHEIPSGEVRIPGRPEVSWIQTYRRVAWVVPVVASLGAWGAYSHCLTDLGTPFAAAACMGVIPTLWSGLQWFQTANVSSGGWHWAKLVSIPYAAFKTLPYALMSVRGLQSWMPSSAAIGFMSIFALQYAMNEHFEMDQWLKPAILSLPKLRDTELGQKNQLKERLNHEL